MTVQVFFPFALVLVVSWLVTLNPCANKPQLAQRTGTVSASIILAAMWILVYLAALLAGMKVAQVGLPLRYMFPLFEPLFMIGLLVLDSRARLQDDQFRRLRYGGYLPHCFSSRPRSASCNLLLSHQ